MSDLLEELSVELDIMEASMSRARQIVLKMGGGAAQTLFYDEFTGDNGTLLSAHTPNIDSLGAGWGATFDIFGVAPSNTIQSNRASAVDVSATRIGGNICDVGAYDGILTCKVTTINTAGSGGNGVIVRQQNSSNRWDIDLVNGAPGTFRITEVNAGVSTVRATTGVAVALNTEYSLQVTLNGNLLTALFNDVTEISYSSSFLATQTNHGVQIITRTGGNASKIDDFKFV